MNLIIVFTASGHGWGAQYHTSYFFSSRKTHNSAFTNSEKRVMKLFTFWNAEHASVSIIVYHHD